ncbi:MAG: response regulator [Candidatus Nitrosopolaris sp.]
MNSILGSHTKRTSIRILIVDDDPDITLTFRAGLEKKGFVVTVFNDPLQCVSKFRTGLYDFVLIDVKMQTMNGFELYREIEKIDHNLKVCFMTSFVVYYESLREIFPKARASCFIKKPIEIDNLVERIIRELKCKGSNFIDGIILSSERQQQARSYISR